MKTAEDFKKSFENGDVNYEILAQMYNVQKDTAAINSFNLIFGFTSNVASGKPDIGAPTLGQMTREEFEKRKAEGTL